VVRHLRELTIVRFFIQVFFLWSKFYDMIKKIDNFIFASYARQEAESQFVKRESVMRRKDREITDIHEIVSVLERCRTIHIGINSEPVPYVLPVSFGVDTSQTMPVIYFHCARQGQKIDLLGDKKNVFVEAETFFKVEKTAGGITTRYESVMGTGLCERVTDPDEILEGLRLLLLHYDEKDYPLDRCKGLQNLYVYRIRLTEITGKHNLPE
jgi:nitroimidazol reductase NimA-like FMN-containing flavoprotein (pyridoxamine 5'-phosphate oxidase superfamily)